MTLESPIFADKNILVVVDDEGAMRTMLKDFFSTQGFTVRAFSSAEQTIAAMAQMDTDKIAAILSDIRMAPMNGKDLLREIRSRYSKVPVVLFTAAGAPEERKEAIRMGADLYLCQPFSLTELKDNLTHALKRRKPNSGEESP